jgi:TetR/AcrR family fatty acid metabolism transcriptional regulator
MPTKRGGEGSAQARLLAAGRMLFARFGYEQASTAAIAHEARTSESQLVRHFGGKLGLLEAIFNDNWAPLNQRLGRIVGESVSAREAILNILAAMIKTLSEDQELAYLLFFEGRRIRGPEHEVRLSQGFLEFVDLLRRLIRRGQKDGTFPEDLDDTAVASALLGAAEAMIRDRILAERAGKPNPFSEKKISRVFAAMLQGLSEAGTVPS